MKREMKDGLLNLMFSIQMNWMNFIMMDRFYLKERKLERLKNFLANLCDKKIFQTNKKFKASIKSWISI